MKTCKKDESGKKEIVAIQCDRCQKVIPNDPDHAWEIQEAVSIDIHCGYGSKTWGDLHFVECDLCEQCIYALISDFARVSRYA